jgi:NAD(P)-dependent dehydrogenase (short-subunit alcohol dehydrogenase family)
MTERSVLITGASSGIGEACALHFADLGFEVHAGVRRDEDGQRLLDASNGRIRPLLLDATDAASVEGALAQIAEQRASAGLEVLVNNAGIAVGGPVEYLSLDDWRRQLEVNVIGQVAVTKASLALLRQHRGGARIVFIGSVAGRVANPFLGPYAASKHAIEAISESLRHELADSDIRSIVVEPGAVRTPIWTKAEASADEIEASLPPEGLARYGARIALMRPLIAYQAKNGVDPASVAAVVAKAATSARPQARYLVGTDAKILGAADRLLPDGLRDSLQRQLSKLGAR